MEKAISIINLKLLELKQKINSLTGGHNTRTRGILKAKIYVLNEIKEAILKNSNA